MPLEQERMPAGAAGVFAEGAADIYERDPVAEQHARERVSHDILRFRLVHERMAAVTRVLRAAVPFGDGMHVMAEQSAEISNLLFEDAAARIWVAVAFEKKRMAAPYARVLCVPVTHRDPFVGMVAEEARQRMANADDLLIVHEQTLATPRTGASCLRECAVMDGVTPGVAPEPSQHPLPPAA